MSLRSSEMGAGIVRRLAAAFRQAGWKVDLKPKVGRYRPDLLVRRGGLFYVVEVKCASEPRRDRVIPLLAQAILQAQAAARANPKAAPLAVVASARIPELLAAAIRRFAREHAPEAAVGVLALDGYRSFSGPGLEKLDAAPADPGRARPLKADVRPNLFSDLNQWMLKVLLAPRIPEGLLSAPRGRYGNASQLAQAANVSLMSASRLVRHLAAEGFLDERERQLRLVRVESLMQRWRAAFLRPPREWPMRWIIRGDGDRQLRKVFSEQVLVRDEKPGSAKIGRKASPPRVCLGLFAAAHALGLGLVSGVKPHLYVDSQEKADLRRLGLMPAEPGQPVDLFLRHPQAPEAVFRGAVLRDGLLVCDVIQAWADVSAHPARGEAQAAAIERRILNSAFRGAE